MDARQEDGLHLIRIDPGEKIIATLVNYIEGKEREFSSGFLTGIGATSSCEIAWYDLTDEEYKSRLVEENCEIISLVGNITWVDGKPLVHAHIALGRKDYSIIGGHLMEGTISITCEIWIHRTPIQFSRKLGLSKSLKLIDFES